MVNVSLQPQKEYKMIKLVGVALLMAGMVNAQGKVISMAYKDDSKQPLIGDIKDNSGMYQELFAKAAKMIGAELKIVRLPKKRVHADLEEGKADFYPGTSFSEDRAKYLDFMDNGMSTKEVCLTRADHAEIKDLKDFKGTVLAELGGSKEKYNEKYPNMKVDIFTKLPMETAEKALIAKRGDMFIADIEEVDYYLKTKKVKSYADLGLKVHGLCRGDFEPMYVGFSIKSPHYKSQPNPKYDASKPLSPSNLPTVTAPGSVAFEFAQALKKLKESGETQAMYNKYFK